jgi:hypothetical protein
MLDRLASSLSVSMPGQLGNKGKGAGHQRKAAYTRWQRPRGGLSIAGA